MRLWLKFLIATGIVIVICLTVVGLIAGSTIRRRFNNFVSSSEQSNLERLVPYLSDYYERNGSWAGLGSFLGNRRGQGQGGQGGQGGQVGTRILLADPNGLILYDSLNRLNGETVAQEVQARGVPIIVQGEKVGSLLSGATLNEAQRTSAYTQSFLDSMSWALVGASLIGGFAAIVVATILALQLTAPARQLTQAAQQVAAGDLQHRVKITSHDELAEVGSAFNEMAAALSRQEELRQHMMADIAHELRTPLAVMQVELESLQDGLSSPTPEVIASLGEEVGLLGRLVEDLRLLSLVEAGQLQLQLQPVHIDNAVEKIAQIVATTAERKGIALQTDLAPDLPPAQADPDRLQQVLLNLLSNALRHTPAGGQISLLAQNEAASIHLQVRDSGEGIPPEDLPYIFDRFYRADSSRSRVTGGSGLGLTIAQGLVLAMGGRIWAESAQSQGTTFHLTLPLA